MKSANNREEVKLQFIGALFLAGVLGLGTRLNAAAIESVAAESGAAQPASPAVRYSPGVADIVKMVDAKVDPDVVLTYIKNSPTAYNPSATEIIALKDHGVRSEILTAMLQHGAEVRAQAMRAARAPGGNPAPQVPPATGNPYAPTYDTGAPLVSPSYGAVYPEASYVYPAYSYDYPISYYGWYNGGYGWPWYWPSFYVGCYPYGGYCGSSHCYSGYRYPYYYGGHGYGRYYTGHGYYGGSAYYGSRGYYSTAAYHGARGGGAYYGGTTARSASFTSAPAGFRAGGGGGGRAMGRSR